MKLVSGWLKGKPVILALLVLAVTLILAVSSGLAQDGDGEQPVTPDVQDLPRTDAVDAFPVVPVEPGVYPNDANVSSVLIIQDMLPWGLDSTQQVLSKHGIGYSTINSSQIAVTDLSPFAMVIVPSSQDYAGPVTFYNNWNANIAKIEAYVNAGGKLWLSTCNQGNTEALTPGGVVSASDSQAYDVVTDPVHPWMWGAPTRIFGGSASHDSFTNLYPGSRILATAETSGNPVVVDYKYGAGQVFLSGMTLEYHYTANWAGKPIFVNSLTKMLGISPIRALIIQDNVGWSNGIQVTLDKLKVRYDQVTSASMASVDMRPYDLIIIPSNQGTTYYNNWNANYSRFHGFASSGSKLWLSAANQTGNPEPILPGGVVGANDAENYNLVVTPTHPWVRGVKARIWGSGTSHDSFSSLVKGSIIVVKAENTGKPTLVDYHHGNGRVMISGMTLEFGWVTNQDNKPILENTLRDLLGIPFFNYMPMSLQNYTPPFSGPYEAEPNDSPGEANGQLILGKDYFGSPNDDSPGEERDWFYFNYNGSGNITVEITGFVKDAQAHLFKDPDYGTFLDSAYGSPGGSGNYTLFHNGSAGAGKYMIWLYAPSGHPTDTGDYTLNVTVN